MNLNRLFLLAAASALLFFGAGCSGINASKSISPLDFFLPGLIQNKPQSDKLLVSVSQPDPARDLAQSN